MEVNQKIVRFIEINLHKTRAEYYLNLFRSMSEDGFKNRIKEDGILILSGLLEMDRETIVSKYSEAGFKEIDFIQMDDWIGIVFKG